MDFYFRMRVLLIRWLTLTLVGWLAYALLYDIVASIMLDMPWYDWLWYLPVSSLFVILPLQLAWRKSFTHRKGLVYGLLLVLSMGGYNGFGQTITLHPAQAATVIISFWTHI